MFLITVIPITRSKIQTNLSYFTKLEVQKGAIVTVPVRSKMITGIVVDSVPVEDLKSEIKNAPFPIKKLKEVKTTIFFPQNFIEACSLLANHYATNIGSIIHALVSDSLLDNVGKLSPALPLQASFLSGAPSPDDTYVIQGDDNDRISSWRSLIRQEFAKKKSVAIYLPTIEDSKKMFENLQKGIEGYIFLLHNGLTPKKIVDTWNEIQETEHSVVIVATGSYAVLPRGDIETLVIERENGRGWIGQRAPYIDQRHAIEFIARRQRQTVYRADSLLRTETLYRLDEHEIGEGSPFKWRSISLCKDILIDMRKGKELLYKRDEVPRDEDEQSTDKTPVKFRVLSPELEKLIAENREESTNLFIMTTRRGIAPTTVCDDCEAIVSCDNCHSPVVLHTSKESGRNFFMCHKCGTRRSAAEMCKKCGSWRLTPLGIGIDRVHQEIEKLYPSLDIFKIDLDTTKTDKQIKDTIEKFYSRPGSVLLGTELALNHIGEKIDHIAVVSFDSLFALPDYRIQEKIMYTLIRLRSTATRTLLVQSRRPEEKVFEYGMKGNLSDFYRMTLEERKMFKYPPYAMLIKISLEGKKDPISLQMSEIQKELEPHEIDIFPAFTSTVRGNSVIHGLLRIEPHAWPDESLIEKLKKLPPGASVKINPESLL